MARTRQTVTRQQSKLVTFSRRRAARHARRMQVIHFDGGRPSGSLERQNKPAARERGKVEQAERTCQVQWRSVHIRTTSEQSGGRDGVRAYDCGSSTDSVAARRRHGDTHGTSSGAGGASRCRRACWHGRAGLHGVGLVACAVRSGAPMSNVRVALRQHAAPAVRHPRVNAAERGAVARGWSPQWCGWRRRWYAAVSTGPADPGSCVLDGRERTHPPPLWLHPV